MLALTAKRRVCRYQRFCTNAVEIFEVLSFSLQVLKAWVFQDAHRLCCFVSRAQYTVGISGILIVLSIRSCRRDVGK